MMDIIESDTEGESETMDGADSSVVRTATKEQVDGVP